MFAKQGTVASHWQTLSQSVEWSTHNFSGDRH
jgi:hypothetical protein